MKISEKCVDFYMVVWALRIKTTDPLVVIAPRVETGSTKLDVYTQWGSKTDLSFVVALKPRRALAQAL